MCTGPGKSGNTYDITDDIPGGSIAGWLEVRDVVIPETQAEFDELAGNLIWTPELSAFPRGRADLFFRRPRGDLRGRGTAGRLIVCITGMELTTPRIFPW